MKQSKKSTKQSKELTLLARSMCKALAKDHGLQVPHSALRAVLLQAHGENPHAFSRMDEVRRAVNEARASTLRQQVKVGNVQFGRPLIDDEELAAHRLYLVDDELGSLEVLALDPEGHARLPDSWRFCSTAILTQLRAKVPDIRRYGLPQYAQSPAAFFAQRFGLAVSHANPVHTSSTGDDSGDTCELDIVMTGAEWVSLVQAALEESVSFGDDVAEWMGQHYFVTLSKLNPAPRAAWVQRYLESHHGRPDPQPVVEVTFEYVYPDEDSGLALALLNLATGELQLKTDVPSDIVDNVVCKRVWSLVDKDWFPDSSTDVCCEAFFSHESPGRGHWKVDEAGLAKLRGYFQQ
ncbi:hypothetical protein D3C71_24110 [compost metagenome]